MDRFPKPTPEIAEDIIALGRICNDFAHVDRKLHHTDTRPENNAEHSYMLGMVASAIVMEYFPELDPGKIVSYSNVHDLVELRILDTATFGADPEMLKEKYKREAEALPKVEKELRDAGWHGLADLLLEYEEQKTPESRFTRVVDKFMPAILHLINNGYSLREIFGVRNKQELENTKANRAKVLEPYQEDFGDLLELKKAVSAVMYAAIFEENGDIVRG